MVESTVPTDAEQDVGGSQGGVISADEKMISARLSEEIVIALVAPIGSGATTTASLMKDAFERRYGYSANIIKISKIINRNRAEHEGNDQISDDDDDRIEKLQEAGNKFREQHGNGSLARLCVAEIHESRGQEDTRRHCTIIDALKHPEEANLLRNVYGNALWIVGVFAPEDVRIARLEGDGKNKTYVEKIKGTDTDEGHDYGQSVRKTMNFSDVFIRNDTENTESLASSIDRFLRLLFGEPVETPSRHETAMYHAAGAGMRSACLSRQVGAVIVSESGEIIGQGANDVPKAGGGLYGAESGKNDHRCFKWRHKHCWNDHHKEKIFKQISNSSPLQTGKDVRKSTDIKNLIEFSRAVHAEMEAIISVARQSAKGIVGSTLYTTTFPCHNCARHIVASGVSKVIYIEPYPKSLALTLHSDSISTIDGDKVKVRFLQYEGIAPQSFDRVFGFHTDRKRNGKVVSVNPIKALPLSAAAFDSLVDRELYILNKHLISQNIDPVSDVDKQRGGEVRIAS